MDFRQAQSALLSRLRTIYEAREAAVITDWVMENITGWKKIDRILHKNDQLPAFNLELLEKYTRELLSRRPVQYVLQESWFCGMKFYVDEHVLIPRPETEELVGWVIEEATTHKHQAANTTGTPAVGGSENQAASHEHQAANRIGNQSASGAEHYSILDVGTGSGCIAIALQKQLPRSRVFACDVSGEALAIAKQNSVSLQVPVHFLQTDFLDRATWENLPPVHYLVSNPPYIPRSDKPGMAQHVVDFEPHLALFVEDSDPLVFYRALANFAREKLLPDGALFAEMHEELAGNVGLLLREAGFQSVVIKKDMQGKDRMIKATW
jgi:release factor glutamine methyltransferase